MSTETNTSLQTGTTPNPISSNAQDFSGSDDEILDNFADGPLPDGADRNDDGTPMGLGGEKGKQSEPASTTLEADIVNGNTSGEESEPSSKPPEDTAGDTEPVQDASEEGSTESEPSSKSEPPEEPEAPEFPPPLLQMAGLADASAAQAAGFNDPEALLAAIKWRGQLFSGQSPGTPSAQPSGRGLYQRTETPATTPAQPAQEQVAEPEGEVQPFQLPSEKMALLDEDLQDVIRQMNDHYQQEGNRYRQEVESLRSSISQRESDLADQQEHDESMRFDKAIQELGEDWHDVFGEGDGSTLAHAGQLDPVAMTNFNHRALTHEAVEAVREVNAKQGYKPMTLEQEVQFALLQRYPDKFQQTISKSSNGKPGPRTGVTASRPTQRSTPPKSRNAKVLSDVNTMLKRKGYSLDMGQEEEFEGEI